MGDKELVTNQNLMEKIEYQNKGFPLSFYEDHLDDYLNGEMGYHWHDDLEFSMVLQGEARYFIHHGGTEQECEVLKEGEAIFVNSQYLHKVIQTKPGTVMFTLVLPVDFFAFLPMGEIHKRNILPVIQSAVAGLFLKEEEKESQPLLNSIRRMHSLSRESVGYELHCMELICRLWRQLLIRISKIQGLPPASKTERQQEQRLRRMLSYIHDHYGEKITIQSLTESANISRSECFRCFRSIGKTPSEYLCQYRLSQAAYFLTYTDRTISDICFSCGFKSMSYFGKLFRENCGMSPGQYRKNGMRGQ